MRLASLLGRIGQGPLRPPLVKGIFQILDNAEPQDGESCWDFLMRYAARLEVHMWMTASGALVIQRPRYDQDPSYVFLISESTPEQNNVIDCSFRLDISGIPTQLRRMGRRISVGEKKQQLESSYDSTVVVPTSASTIIPEASINVDESFNRQRWNEDTEARDLDELGRRNFYALRNSEVGFQSVELTVDGHDQGGKLYAPDTVCRLVHEKLGIDRNMYVSACEYTQGRKSAMTEGKRTRITLTNLNAWIPEEIA